MARRRREGRQTPKERHDKVKKKHKGNSTKEVKLGGVKRHAGNRERERRGSAGEDGKVEGLERRGRSVEEKGLRTEPRSCQLLPSTVSET